MGAGLIVMFTWSLTGLHVPLPTVVRVKVAVPSAISAALGTYVAFNVVAFGEKVPEPPLHNAPLATLIAPLS